MNTETETEFDPFENEKAVKASTGKGVAWLALLLALAAGSFSAWQWWEGNQESDTGAQTQAAIDQLETAHAALARELGAFQQRVESLEGSGFESDLQALTARINANSSASGAQLQRIETLEQADTSRSERLSSMENALAALAVRGESPAQRMEMAEVDYLLRTASERLHLFGDTDAAERALALANDQLQAIGDPLYTPVRQKIAVARQQLAELPGIDGVTINADINRLQSRIPALPLQGEWRPLIETASTESNDMDLVEPSLWQRFKSTLSGLVTVQRRTEDMGLVSIEDQAYVQQGLWLQLESARLALMRRDAEAYSMALERALAALAQFFEPAADATGSMQQGITQLQQVPLDVPLPDISAPWAELQRLNQVRAPLPSQPRAGRSESVPPSLLPVMPSTDEPEASIEALEEPAALVPEQADSDG